MNAQRRKAGEAALAMAIFGTIGVFRRWISLPSGTIALARAAIGVLFLLVLLAVRKRRPDGKAVRKNICLLCISGACLGGNWILLFEAYNHTTIAVATLCYEMGPTIVLLLSPFLFGEHLTRGKAVCAALAVLGMVLTSGVLEDGGANGLQQRGVLLALGAACLYAGVMLSNRRIRGIGALDRTVIQLGMAAIILLPYVLLAERSAITAQGAAGIAALLIVGIVHTGIAYALYFGALGDLPAQTAALLSYIDPALAVLLSALVLREPISATGIAGALLVLGPTAAAELIAPEPKNKNREDINSEAMR